MTLAELINESAMGAIDYLLANVVEGQTALEVMSEMLAREVYYSYENVLVAEHQGDVIGMALSFPADGLTMGEQLDDIYSPQQLQYIRYFVENKLDDSWHLDALCVHEKYRSAGVGACLLNHVKRIASDYEFRKLGMYVFGSNERAIRFYKKHGFIERGKIDTSEHEFLSDKRYLCLMDCPL